MIDLRDGRSLRRIYPWDKLKKKGDAFYWDNINDAQRIRSASKNYNMKVSVRTIDKKLQVVRVS